MTNEEHKEKYPIGTKVKYIIDSRWASTEAKKDIGKTGEIVGYTRMNHPIILLPESEHISCCSTATMKASWACWWKSIEILSQKNEQLLFDFAY